MTKVIHLLKKTSLLLKHIFWISVAIMQVCLHLLFILFNLCIYNYQLQEPLTYVAAQLLLYECVKMLDSEQSFLKKVNKGLLSFHHHHL